MPSAHEQHNPARLSFLRTDLEEMRRTTLFPLLSLLCLNPTAHDLRYMGTETQPRRPMPCHREVECGLFA
jgi:hypothetical protein